MMIVTIPTIWTSFKQTEILQYAHPHHVLFTVATTKSRVCDVKVAKARYIHTSSAIKEKEKRKRRKTPEPMGIHIYQCNSAGVNFVNNNNMYAFCKMHIRIEFILHGKFIMQDLVSCSKLIHSSLYIFLFLGPIFASEHVCSIKRKLTVKVDLYSIH